MSDPFADLDLSPELLKAARDVHDRVSTFIDEQVASLRDRMSESAGAAANRVATEAQQKLAQSLNDTDTKLQSIENTLAKLKATFTDAGLKEQSDKLQAAITAHRTAVEEQRANIQNVGQLVGSTVKNVATKFFV